MKRALISDIHANLEALRVVLADLQKQGLKEIFCLGDIIGYGPNPCECLDEVMNKCKVTIQGNHDQAAIIDPDGFNPVALQAVYWTRDQLDRGPGGPTKRNGRWDFVGALPRTFNEGDYLFVHGSPREPTNEYVFPEDIYNQRKMDALFGRIQKYCFQGHTHLPGIFTEDYRFITPEECGYKWPLTEQKVMINVGSVGQPRDMDSRSCYVVLTEQFVEFRRVPYPLERTMEKILSIPELDPFLAERLKEGR